MKHSIPITIIFLALFLLSHIAGLLFMSASVDAVTSNEVDDTQSIVLKETAVGDRPTTQGISSIIMLIIGVGIGTVLLLVIAKFKKKNLWKFWYFLAAWVSITIVFGIFAPAIYAWILALLVAFVKIKYRNIFLHNFTEILMYSGIAILIAPTLTVWSALLLLFIISIYDYYAVYKSKHMVKLAKFTAKSELFPGLTINYKLDGDKTKIVAKSASSGLVGDDVEEKNKVRSGVLGGGDVVFPLLFSCTILLALIHSGYSLWVSFWIALIPSITVAIALGLLFSLGKRNQFYPAMPVVFAGALVGYGFVFLVQLI